MRVQLRLSVSLEGGEDQLQPICSLRCEQEEQEGHLASGARCTKGNREVADVHLGFAEAAVEYDGDHDRQHEREQDGDKVAQTHDQARGNTVVTSLANRAEISAPSALASAISRFSSPASPGVRPRLIGTTTRTSASSV